MPAFGVTRVKRAYQWYIRVQYRLKAFKLTLVQVDLTHERDGTLVKVT